MERAGNESTLHTVLYCRLWVVIGAHLADSHGNGLTCAHELLTNCSRRPLLSIQLGQAEIENQKDRGISASAVKGNHVKLNLFEIAVSLGTLDLLVFGLERFSRNHLFFSTRLSTFAVLIAGRRMAHSSWLECWF